MGYRHYFHAVPKTQIEAIRKCKTNEEFCEWAESAGYDIDRCEDEPTYVPVYRLGEEIYEFGKYVEWAFAMQEKNESIFISEELNKCYEDYTPVLCSKEDFLSVIDIYKKKIASYLESLLSNDEYATAEQKCQKDIAEAIKEFAERLNIHVIPQKRDGYTCDIVLKSSIDSLVKEMTEEHNAEENSI